MKRVLLISLSLLLLTASGPLSAKVISIDEARKYASQYLQSVQLAPSHDISDQISIEPVVLTKYSEPAVYVFNRPQGGFVIVSADDAADRQILGWSDQGSYDPENVPAQLQYVLENYASGIAEMRKSSIKFTDSGSSLKVSSSLPDSVSPLLGDIAWGQGTPYNLMCPTYSDGSEEYHYVTGCVATAVAQVMKFNRWPAQGKGSNSYVWHGQTLSADFSQSSYLWDMMLPNYNNGTSYSQEQADAVALLMHDIGIALNMNYELSGSGTSLTGYELVNFFDYDKNLRSAIGDYCTKAEWENVLYSELAAGYPVICGGGSIGGAHEFVCDGYNADGLFHYNFGWDGMCNGWFASSATGYDSSPTLIYGIRPNHGGQGMLSLHSKGDFKWTENDFLSGQLRIEGVGVDRNTSFDVEVGLALENTETGNVDYYQVTEFKQNYFSCMGFDFSQQVPDGTYKAYPVARIAGGEWQTFFHNSLYQLEVDLTVNGGVKTWANNGILDPIDDGTVLVGSIYYTLNSETLEATVTRRNSKGNSYSGYVVIPDVVSYMDTTYSVTVIGKQAFHDCAELDSVTVGANVRELEMGAFSSSSLKTVRFVEGSKLETVGGWAFNACLNLEEMVFPEGTKSLGMCAFQSCFSLKNLELPSSVYFVAQCCLNACHGLESIHVKWTSLDNVYCYDDFASDGLSSDVILYVPRTYSQIYNVGPWNYFTVVEGGEVPPLEEKYLYVLGCDGNWNPAQASDSLAYRTDHCYAGDITVTDLGDGYGYFCIGEVLSASWDFFNAHRLGAPSANYTLSSGKTCVYVLGQDASFKAVAGAHHIVVDMNQGTIAFDCEDGIVPVNAAYGNLMFDLDGRPVENPRPGRITIINGKKYIAR